MLNNSLDFKILHSISEVDPASWDQLSAGRPFTSHQWYRYGEAVMADTLPIYLIVYHEGQPVARATFWRATNEPIPIRSPIFRKGIGALLKRWPLLICRSPICSLPGVILPDTPLRTVIQAEISAKAIQIMHETDCSFLAIDYLQKKDSMGWAKNFISVSFLDPGTIMPLTWPSFEAYLNAGNKKDRQHYKRTLREAEKLGIQITRHRHVDSVDEALRLIHAMEQRFGSITNPWNRAMLENLEMVNGIFLMASINDQMVGCGLILQDNNAQMNTTLGLVENVQYVYFMLVYESIKLAFETHMSFLRLGSGAYDVKKQLGFSLEDNNSLLFAAANPVLQKLGQWLSKP